MGQEAERYSARAGELEAAASTTANPSIRASYLELARSFREMANLVDLAGSSSDDDVVQLAERMVGKPRPASGSSGSC